MSEKVQSIPYLSIVFSFRNEEESLSELIRRVRAVMSQMLSEKSLRGYELIFVNDASSDRSLSILLEEARGRQDIRIINMSRCFGVSPCVMAGLAHAKGDAVVYMDADLQDPPELIPHMVAAWQGEDNIDVVHTVRRSRAGEPRLKLWITKIGYLILNRYCVIPIPREAGDFKLLSRRVVDHLLALKEQNPFIRGLVCWVGFKQVFVPYDRHGRYAGRSQFFVLSKKVVSNFLNSAIVHFSAVPLQIASYIGLLAIFIDMVLFVYVVWLRLHDRILPGGTVLLLVVLFLGGVQLLGIGMIGLYLNSVHDQTKMRPRYIIESTFGFPPDSPHA